MADLSDVTHALRDAVAAVLYPSGVPGGALPLSIANAPVRVYVGWPGADLDADLKAGVAHVTIWPRPGMARTMGPYLTGWEDHPGPAATMTVTVDDDELTFAGTATIPGMIAAVIVDGAASYTHQISTGQTPAQVAAALAALVNADTTATATGAVLAVPGSILIGRIVAAGTEQKEMRRIEQSIQISIWASKPTVRDAIAQALDVAIEVELRTLLMPDGTKATVNYQGTGFEDEARQQPLHRRDLFVGVEYSMRRVRPVPGIAVPVSNIAVDPTVIRRVVIS